MIRRTLALVAAAMMLSIVAHSSIAQESQPEVKKEAPTLGTLVTRKGRMEQVISGWSVKNDVLGKEVYNDARPPKKLGTVADVVIDPNTAISFGIIEVGGFLGMGTKLVVIESGAFSLTGGKYFLPGVTREALEAAPEFKYAR